MVADPTFDVSAYSDPLISERSIDEPRPLKVIHIGAGISGILAAIFFPQYVPDIDLVIYDKNGDVGGTWFENRYPGIACDIPAHSYQLSFESNIAWSQFYASGPEILKYWQRIADKYNTRRYMKFKHKCTSAIWNESTSKWHVTIQKLDEKGSILDSFEDISDVLVTGTGALNQWKWPNIPGLHDFKGTLMHSATWDTSFDATGKKIALIGAGSSGIQIAPALQKSVKQMDYYVRGRTWIAATFGHEVVEQHNNGQDGNFSYTTEEQEKWRRDPASYIEYRKALEVGMQGSYAVTHKGTQEHITARQIFDNDMRQKLAPKPEIIDHLLPDFPPCCKRLTPGPGYLEALCAPNVNVIATPISNIDSTGITTNDGIHHAVDAIICATGFDTSFHHRFPLIGRNNQDLQARYQARPETYLSLCTDGFPNYFQTLGPNSGLGNGNLLILIESLQRYIAQILQRLSTTNLKTIEAKPRAVQNFTNYCDAFFKRTVFSAPCPSWYKTSPPWVTDPEERKHGRVSALWPGSSIHAVHALRQPRWEDFEMESLDGNEFGWFGDGWSVAERNRDVEGLSWYLNETRFLHEDLPDPGKVELKAGQRQGQAKAANEHELQKGKIDEPASHVEVIGT